MRNLWLCGMAVMAVSLLSGCFAERYLLITEDYTLYQSTTKPVIDPKTNTVTFENQNGEEVTLPQDQIKKMQSVEE